MSKRPSKLTLTSERTAAPSSVAKTVLSMPIFHGISPAARKRVRASLETIEMPQGTSFLVEGTPPDDVYFICKGEVALTHELEMVAISKAPTIIGLLSLLDGETRSASAHAFTDCTLAVMSRQKFDELLARSARFMHNIVEYLGREVRALHADAERRRRQFDDVFQSPNARLYPGPYRMDNCDLFAFVMTGPNRVIERMLPEGVTTLPGAEGRYVLLFGFYPSVRSIHEGANAAPVSYAEAAILVPGQGPDGRAVVFCPEQYPDNYMAIALGRELYGFPRRYGRTSLEQNYIDLDLDRTIVARAAWTSMETVDADAFRTEFEASMTTDDGISPAIRRAASVLGIDQAPGITASLPFLVLNQVPSTLLTAGTQFRINELVQVPIIVENLRGFQLLSGAHVRHFTTSWLVAGKCLCGLRLKADMTFGLPKVERKLEEIGDVTFGRRLWTDVKSWLP